MKIWEGEQGTREWHDLFRKNGIGASEVAAVLGESPYSTPFDVFQEKTGRAFPQIENEAMRAGKEAESVILQEYNLLTNKNHQPTCAISDDYDFMRCSFDGYDSSTGSIIEIKYSRYEKLARCLLEQSVEHFKKVYPTYYYQVMYQMYIADAHECTLVTISAIDGRLLTLTIPRDDDVIYQKMLPELVSFWEGNVMRDIAPEKGKDASIFIDDEELFEKENRLKIALANQKIINEEVETLKKEIYDFGDDGDFHGKIFAFKRVTRKGNVDTKKLYEAYGITDDDAEKYRKASLWFYKVEEL